MLLIKEKTRQYFCFDDDLCPLVRPTLSNGYSQSNNYFSYIGNSLDMRERGSACVCVCHAHWEVHRQSRVKYILSFSLNKLLVIIFFS